MINRAARRGRDRATGIATVLLSVPVFSLFSGAVIVATPAKAVAAAPPRPIVVLFLGGLPPNMRLTEPDLRVVRTRAAAQAVRTLLRDSGVVDPVLYTPDTPMFVRAQQEAKLSPGTTDIPSEADQVAIARAVGALYSVAIMTHDAPEETRGGIDIELQATEVATRKVWAERGRAATAKLNTVAGPSSPAGPTLSDGTERPAGGGPAGDALLSAANTLVQKFLIGPLGEYTRTTTPPSLLPPKAPQPAIPSPTETSGPTPPANVAGPPTPASPSVGPQMPQPDAARPAGSGTAPPVPNAMADNAASSGTDTQAEALRQQAEQQLAAGDMAGAILSLRHAVNLEPINLPVRATLVRAYAAAKQFPDALAEGRRALTIAPPEDRQGRLQVTRIMADALQQQGDVKAARALYEQIIAAQPASTPWARLALADLLAAQNEPEPAAAQYRLAIKAEPGNREAHFGLARVLAAQGDYEGALAQMTTADKITGGPETGDPAMARYNTARALFDDGTLRIARLLRQNRVAYQQRTLGREVFYKATETQGARINSLLSLLRAVPPPGAPGTELEKAHRRRIFAASLLSQAVADILAALETNKPDSQATVYLSEFEREMAEVGAATATTKPDASSTAGQ